MLTRVDIAKFHTATLTSLTSFYVAFGDRTQIYIDITAWIDYCPLTQGPITTPLPRITTPAACVKITQTNLTKEQILRECHLFVHPHRAELKVRLRECVGVVVDIICVFSNSRVLSHLPYWRNISHTFAGTGASRRPIDVTGPVSTYIVQ